MFSKFVCYLLGHKSSFVYREKSYRSDNDHVIVWEKHCDEVCSRCKYTEYQGIKERKEIAHEDYYGARYDPRTDSTAQRWLMPRGCKASILNDGFNIVTYEGNIAPVRKNPNSD